MIRYKCLLQGQGIESLGQLEAAGLCLNPMLRLQEGSDLPRQVEDEVFFDQCFSLDRPIVWVVDPKTGFWLPFWLEAELYGLLREILRGTRLLADLSPGMMGLLVQACVLIDRASAERLRDGKPAWGAEAYVGRAREQLQASRYVVLQDVVHPLQAEALRLYYRRMLEAGRFETGDTQATHRLVLSAEPTACFLHQQLEFLVNRILPQRIKASYCFLMAYGPGAVLPRHVDRKQCAWNVSLALDARPQVDRKSAWPLVLETDAGLRPVGLAVGDAVLYSGTTMPHWRDALAPEHRVILCAFHFVPEDFHGDLN